MLVDTRMKTADEVVKHGLVVRTEPTGETIFPSYDMALQAKVMDAVARNSDVPVARLRWYESDPSVLGRPFFAMDLVEGLVPPDNVPYTMQGFVLEASPDEQRRLQLSGVEVLASLHSIDLDSAGLRIVDRPEFGPTGLQQQLGFYDYYLDWAAQGRPQPVLEQARRVLRTNRPAEPRTGPTLGDSRLGHPIYRDLQPEAIVGALDRPRVPAGTRRRPGSRRGRRRRRRQPPHHALVVAPPLLPTQPARAARRGHPRRTRSRR